LDAGLLQWMYMVSLQFYNWSRANLCRNGSEDRLVSDMEGGLAMRSGKVWRHSHKIGQVMGAYKCNGRQ
jgi:hypothetical protein